MMKKIFAKKIIWFMLGMIAGGLLVLGWQRYLQKVMEERNNFSYGVVSSTLQAEDIIWQEYPQFRTVKFILNGEFVVTIPHDAELSPEGLRDAGALLEKNRKTKTLGYGAEKLIFDEVTYHFEDAEILANMPKVYGNPEKDATYGYELSYMDEEQEVVFAFILPMCEEFYVCTKEQTEHWKYSQSVELGFLSLSKTYPDEDITCEMEVCPTVKMEKKEKTFEFLITNEDDVEWDYSAMVPSVEVWNQGVWMELATYLDNPAILRRIQPGEVQSRMLPEHVIETFPYFAPGLYRVVVYGGDKTYIATENFVIE